MLVRNLFMSVDPYMRGRMNDVKSYVPPFQVGQPLEGGAIGEVIESRAPDLKTGDIVQSMRGWRDYFVAPASDLRTLDRSISPLSAYLGVLGMPGLTAWVGLKLVELKPTDWVFISAAAGAVGSIAGQLAKLRGCFVVGSAGSDDKVALLTRELGFDAAFSYRDGAAPGTPPLTGSALRQRLTRPRRTESMCTSTTLGATIWRRRLPACETTDGSRPVDRSHATTTKCRSPAHETCFSSSRVVSPSAASSCSTGCVSVSRS